ncbi:MAG TPA: hypothetical protein VD833_10530 [Vicinamibacterales bacterium]|nr:hypothetical protein [Vicinamibacterales bacterium]
MIRAFISGAMIAAAFLATPPVGATAQQPAAASPQPAPVTPDAAKPFLGEWTLALQGPNGPGTFDLSVKVEKETVVGEIASEALPKQAITDVSLDEETLVLGYTFTWEGNPVDAVVSLTPEKDGKTGAQIDFAGGAYVMVGTATRKEAAK